MDPIAPERSLVWPALVWWGLLTATILFVPAYPVGLLDGIPADHVLDFVVAIGAAAFLIPRDFSNVSRRHGACLLALLVLCAGLRMSSHWAYGSHGLKARYEMAAGSGQSRLARSTRCGLSDASRLDENVDFDGIRVGIGRHPLWTDFLNSLDSRGNSNPLATPLRVHWTGFVRPPRDCTLAIDSNGAPAVLQVPTLLRAGHQYPLSTQASFPNLDHPRIRLLTQDDQLSVPTGWLSPDERVGGSTPIAALFGMASWAAAAAWVYFFFRFTSKIQPRARYLAIIGECLILLIAVVSGAILWEFNGARDSSCAILPPDDYLLYENEARSLVFNGFLRDDGVAFHRSPAMRYYLAAAHALFGESGYGVILFQQLLRGATGILVLRLMRELAAPTWNGWVAAGIVILLPGPMTLSLRYWPETPGALLLAGLCLALARGEGVKSGAASPISTGFMCGLLALVRTNAVSLVPAIVVWSLVRGRGWRFALLFLVPAIAVLCFVPLRNYAVTGECIVTPTEGAVTMVLGNNVPRDTNIEWAFSGSHGHDELLRQGMEKLWEFDHNRLASYDPFLPADNARMAPALMRVWLAYVAQHPRHFLTQVLGRLWHWFFPGWHVASVLSLFVLAGFGFLIRGRAHRAWWTVWTLTAAYSAPFWIAYFEPRHRAVILPELTALALFGVGCWTRALGGVWQKLFAHVEHRDVWTDLSHLPGEVAANLRKRLHGKNSPGGLFGDGERSVPDEFLDGGHESRAHAQTAKSHAQ
jgi:hypothetical protein